MKAFWRKVLFPIVMACCAIFAFAACEEKPEVFDVTFVYGEHAAESGRQAVQSVEAQTTIVLPPAAEPSEGWEFGGWLVDGESTVRAAGSSYVVVSDVIIRAVWEPEASSGGQPGEETEPKIYRVTVSYGEHAAENEPDMVFTVEEGEIFSLPAVPTAEKGYRFTGWYCGDQLLEEDFYPSEEITITAHYSLIEYTIAYQADGLSLPPTKYTIESEGITLPEPIKKGYEFIAWRDKDGNAVTAVDVSAARDMTLYAEFSLINYTITYELSEGINSADNPASFTVETPTFSLADPERENYIFKGWLAGEQTQPQYAPVIEQGTVGNLTFTAVWERETHRLIVDGEEVAVLPTGSSYLLTVPQKEGATFMGWSDANGNPIIGAQDSLLTMGKSDIVLETRWAVHSAIADEEQLLAVIGDTSADKIVLSADIFLTKSLLIERTAVVDLAGFTLQLSSLQGESPMRLVGSQQSPISVKIENGEICFTADDSADSAGDFANVAAVEAQFANLAMQKIKLFSCGCGMRLVDGTYELSFVNVEAEGVYAIEVESAAVRTNASLSDCTAISSMADGAGVVFASDGTLKAERSEMIGGRQGLILRMGTATIEGGKICSRVEGTSVDPAALPLAAIIVGDRSAGNYRANADLTVSGVQICMGTEANGDAVCVRLFGDEADETTAQLHCICTDSAAELYRSGKILAENAFAAVDVAHARQFLYVEEQNATCASQGVLAHYVCSDCGATFLKDDYGTYTPVSQEELLTPENGEHVFSETEFSDPKDPTCTEDGSLGYVYCTVCHTYFTPVDGEYVPVSDKSDLVIPAHGHEISFQFYAEDGYFDLVCLHDACEFMMYGYVVVTDESGGMLALETSDFSFNVEKNCLELTLPTCDMTPPDGKTFQGYMIGGVLYDENSIVEIISGEITEIFIVWG